MAFAKGVDADFLFCLHYNLSKDHNTLFGAECWVSAFGRRYSEGYAFADIEMAALEELGLYSRGIKTRLGKQGEDYYGIIRHSREQELTCVLIEHCHMDHENDRPFCEGREQWETFGRLDATSVAKYFRLHSDSLGVDYSDYPVLESCAGKCHEARYNRAGYLYDRSYGSGNGDRKCHGRAVCRRL